MKRWKYRDQPKYLRVIQAILLTLIAIGIALLITQSLWVPKLVAYIIAA